MSSWPSYCGRDFFNFAPKFLLPLLPLFHMHTKFQVSAIAKSAQDKTTETTYFLVVLARPMSGVEAFVLHICTISDCLLQSKQFCAASSSISGVLFGGGDRQ